MAWRRVGLLRKEDPEDQVGCVDAGKKPNHCHRQSHEVVESPDQYRDVHNAHICQVDIHEAAVDGECANADQDKLDDADILAHRKNSWLRENPGSKVLKKYGIYNRFVKQGSLEPLKEGFVTFTSKALPQGQKLIFGEVVPLRLFRSH